MSKALCKQRYFAKLIGRRQICLGMTKVMVESAWRMPWRKFTYSNGEEVWEWGQTKNPHSKVTFNAEGVVRDLFSVVHHRKGESWSR